jgi:pimeloyl-ACP methyl ester carboxylesterase
MDWNLFWHKTLRRPFKLHTSMHGESDKPVIVLLHGIAASSDDWGKVVTLLSPHYRCITIDLLGFAHSPKPQWSAYSMDDHLRSIHYTLSTLNLPSSYILAGHSLGSLLATRYVRQHPQRVQQLLLLSPPVYPPLDTIGGKTALRRTDLLLRIYKFLRTHPKMTPENVRRLSFIVPIPRSITTYPETWIPFFRTLEECIEQQTIIEDIRSIAIPIDIFYGSLDTVVIADNVRQLATTHYVQLHSFRGNHTIGRRYALTVVQTLLR